MSDAAFDEDDELLIDTDDDTDLVKKLRKRVKDGRGIRQERDTLKDENNGLRVENVLFKSGLNTLNEDQQKAVLSVVSDDATVDTLKAAAVRLGFIQPDVDEQQNEEGQQQIANAAANQDTGANRADTITASDFNKWDMPRKQDFMKRHPDKFEALKRGETVKA